MVTAFIIHWKGKPGKQIQYRIVIEIYTNYCDNPGEKIKSKECNAFT